MSILCSTSVRSGSSLEVALKEISALGYKKIDVLGICEWNHVLPRLLAEDYDNTAAKVNHLLDQYGLTMCSMNIGTNQQLWDRSPKSNQARQDELEALCRFMQAHGVKVAAVQPLSNDTSRDFKAVINDCILSLQQFVDVGAKYGIEMGVELHFNSPFEFIEQIDYLFEAMPHMKIVYDPSHLIMQGLSPKDYTYLMDKAAHVHIRDSAKDTMQAHLGDGDVDFAWMIGELKKKGYNGHYSIEYLEDEKDDFLPDVPKLYQLLEGLLSE